MSKNRQTTRDVKKPASSKPEAVEPEAVEPEAVEPEAVEPEEGKVIVSVPKAFKLTTAAGVVDYPAGAYAMRADHADHWFAQASGVKKVEG